MFSTYFQYRAVRNNVRKGAALVLALLLCGMLAAQSLLLQVDEADIPAVEQLIHDLKPRPRWSATDTLSLIAPDSAGLFMAAQALLSHLQKNAHLTVSFDSLEQRDDSTYSARLYLGPSMYWIRIRPATAESNRWLDAAGFREKLFTGTSLRHDALLRIQQNILEQAENNGYPFASIRLDSVRADSSGGISAALRIDRGAFFTFKNLKINGNARLPKTYLPQYLGIRAGAPYSRARVLRIRERINTLLFVEPAGNPTVTFAGSEATVNLFLQKKRASRFDFIIGLLPQPNSADGRLLVTGSLNAAFLNALNLGERFSLELERLRPETQKLDVQAGVPYLFGLPFGVEGRLNIFRRDSTWVDAQSNIGVQYLLEGGNYISFFWENKSSSLQKVDTTQVIQTRRLPAALDLRQTGFGLETSLNHLDYRFNPRRGWSVTLRGVAGFNTVLRNNQIEALRDPQDSLFRFSSLYDSIAGRATRYRLEGQAQWFIPLFVRSTIKIGVRSGGIFSDKPVYANEQYRLGGNKLQRGFNEESLFATRFAVATAEFRLLIGQNSFLSAFTDYGYIENRTDRNRLFQRPWGLGAGLNFETQAGIFGINLAVGRPDAGQAFDWRAPKFHLGYVSLF